MKTEVISFKVSPEEKDEIKKMAQDADMSVSKYIYRLIFPKGE